MKAMHVQSRIKRHLSRVHTTLSCQGGSRMAIPMPYSQPKTLTL